MLYLLKRKNFDQEPLTLKDVRFLTREFVQTTNILRRALRGGKINDDGIVVWKPGFRSRLEQAMYLPSEWMGKNKWAAKLFDGNDTLLRSKLEGPQAAILPKISEEIADRLTTQKSKDHFIDLVMEKKKVEDDDIESSAVEAYKFYTEAKLPELRSEDTVKDGKVVKGKDRTIPEYLRDTIHETYNKAVLPRF